VALVQVKLRRRKNTNAQLGFFENSSKLLQTFIALESQIEERILERTEVKVERIEEDHVGHNSGGDAPLSPLLDPLEGLNMLNCEKLGLEGRSRLPAQKGGVEGRASSLGIRLRRGTSYLVIGSCIQNQPQSG
jgi:hypothetical protein